MVTVRSSEKLIQKRKLEANMKTIFETMDLRKTMFEIANGKRVMTPRSKNKLKKEGISIRSRSHKDLDAGGI